MKRTILRECIRLAWEKEKNHPYIGMNFRNKHFSFIVQDNKIISTGMNRPEDAFCAEYSGFYSDISGRHSEPDAWKKAKGLLRGEPFEIVNLRIANKKIAGSQPCACCTAFLLASGCTAVWFSTGVGFAKISF